MRNRGIGFLFVGIFLAGCQGADTVSKSVAAPAPVKTVAAPTMPVEVTAIQMVGPHGMIRVGDADEKALAVYPPTSKSPNKLRELPERFAKPYGVQGWETARGEGFGIITWDGAIVAAMYQVERGDEQMLSEILSQQRSGTGTLYPNDILGKSVRFWFWEDKSQRLMVCAAQNPDKFLNITVAMGDRVVLDALGASPEAAKQIQDRLDGGSPPQLIQETLGKATNGEHSPSSGR